MRPREAQNRKLVGQVLDVDPIAGKSVQHIEQLIAAEEEFWDRIQHGVPPEANYEHRATSELIKRLYPGTNGSVIRLPSVAGHYARVMADAREQMGIYEKIIEGCKNRVGMMMGKAAAGLMEEGCFIRKEVKRAAYEVKETSYMTLTQTDKLPKLVTEALEKNAVIDSPALIKEHSNAA